jgi:hypothetical protein
MTDVLSAPRRVRGPAYAATTECLRIQATARRQSRLAWLFGRDPILPDARTWYRGALGEIGVAKALRALGDGWAVLYSTSGDVPDLVIGRAGVFLITTRDHSRQRVWVGDDQLLGSVLLVNGRRTDHIRDARHHARRVSHLLGIIATPVIAIVDPAPLVIKERVDGVEVLASSQLSRFLLRRKVRLTDDAVAALLAAASATGEWGPEVVEEALPREARFLRLVAEVEAAGRRRVGWLVPSGAVGLASLFALVPR